MSKEFVKGVLTEDADEHIPMDANIWPAMRSQLQEVVTSTWRQPRLRVSPLALAGVLALLLLALGLLASATLTKLPVTQPAPVSAAELLAKVEEATNGSGTSTITSFHGVLAGEQRNNSWEEFSQLREEQWYLAPNRYRSEAHFTTPTGEEPVMMWVTNGEKGWRYDSYFGKADPLAESELKWAFGASDVKALLSGEMVKNFYNLEVIGTEQVGSRTAYVVESTIKPASEWPRDSGPSLMARALLWVDTEYIFILRFQSWDAEGNILSENEYESYELNGVVDPALFDIPPPTPSK